MTIGHELKGSGPEGVIVLHGWFGDHTAFAPMFPYLDSDTFTYAFLDYRGYGASRDMDGEHTMSEIASDAIELADHLGWKRFHVVGHSMGGMAMQRTAIDANGRVKCGVAITPVPASGVPLDEDGQALFGGAPDNDENRRAIIDFTTGGRNSGIWLDYKVARSRETTTRDAFADYLVAWTQTNFMEEVKGLELPVLVLYGEFDQALTKDAMEQTYMAWLPNAELKMIGNAGHYPMDEAPVNLATSMEAFMRDHSG
jgi:pimeloyl-ACP methyl ester carboxylesterase